MHNRDSISNQKPKQPKKQFKLCQGYERMTMRTEKNKNKMRESTRGWFNTHFMCIHTTPNSQIQRSVKRDVESQNTTHEELSKQYTVLIHGLAWFGLAWLGIYILCKRSHQPGMLNSNKVYFLCAFIIVFTRFTKPKKKWMGKKWPGCL